MSTSMSGLLILILSAIVVAVFFKFKPGWSNDVSKAVKGIGIGSACTVILITANIFRGQTWGQVAILISPALGYIIYALLDIVHTIRMKDSNGSSG
jgi:xanthine/uracil permease